MLPTDLPPLGTSGEETVYRPRHAAVTDCETNEFPETDAILTRWQQEAESHPLPNDRPEQTSAEILAGWGFNLQTMVRDRHDEYRGMTVEKILQQIKSEDPTQSQDDALLKAHAVADSHVPRLIESLFVTEPDVEPAPTSQLGCLALRLADKASKIALTPLVALQARTTKLRETFDALPQRARLAIKCAGTFAVGAAILGVPYAEAQLLPTNSMHQIMQGFMKNN